jgi:hypothetical protein
MHSYDLFRFRKSDENNDESNNPDTTCQKIVTTFGKSDVVSL